MGSEAARLRLAWPLSALLAWGLAWLSFLWLRGAVGAPGAAACAGLAVGPLAAAFERAAWRRVAIVAGFPLSFGLAGFGAALPPWAWLIALGLLFVAYPPGAWGDAPLFPTPAHALDALAQVLPLAPGARVLDAGCGLGHALVGLRRAYPQAELHGIERSAPLAWWCARRCGDARVRRGSMWAEDWSCYDLVYLYQRPESMPSALEKARRELRAGAWLVSLEFEAPGASATRRLEGTAGRSLWLYRMP
jgi:hypothetical protein